MENKVYRLFGEKGMMEEIKPVGELPIGTRILAFGSGMCQTEYCVTGSKTAQGQEICLISNYNEDSYFSAPRKYLDNYCQPLSKKFGIGFYWDDIENIVFSESKVKAAIRRADYLEKYIYNKEMADKLAKQKELQELPARFPHLKPINPQEDQYKQFRANLASELKHRFPDTKFSIKKQHYGCIYISWVDGASLSEVKKVSSMFEDHETDETGDFRDYSPSNFNLVFGGINFIFEERDYSFDIEKLAEELSVKAQYDKRDAREDVYQILCQTSFPKGAVNLRIEPSNVSCGSMSDCYKIASDEVESKEVKNVESNMAPTEGVEVVDYSDKSFVLYGNTKPIKEQLKELGGRFNMNLRASNGFTFAGWVFPITKKEGVLEALGI